jgi:hypothetical protein
MLEMESRLGSQSRGSKRKNVPGTPVHSSHKLGKMTGNDRTAAPENKPRSKQQTAVCPSPLACFISKHHVYYCSSHPYNSDVTVHARCLILK